MTGYQNTLGKRYHGPLAIAWIFITMGIVGQADFEEAQRQADQYCKMVGLWEQTDGQAGWPAYDEGTDCTRYFRTILEPLDASSYPLDHSIGVPQKLDMKSVN